MCSSDLGLTNNIMLPRPDVDINRIEDGKQRETPGDAVDDHALAVREELVNYSTEKQKMNEGPRTRREHVSFITGFNLVTSALNIPDGKCI